MKRAACPLNSWKDTWWFSSLMPLRSRCLGSVPIWHVLPLSLKVLAASPFSLSSGLSVPCLMLWTQLHKGWKVEVGRVSVHPIQTITSTSCCVYPRLPVTFWFCFLFPLFSPDVWCRGSHFGWLWGPTLGGGAEPRKGGASGWHGCCTGERTGNHQYYCIYRHHR